MKKSLIALAVLAASGAAMAQSTVTLYGRVDASIGTLKTGAVPGAGTLSQTGVFNGSVGGLTGSRWGLRGTEDLGGGLTASFKLENRYNVDLGTQTDAFLGESFVALGGGFGTVKLGRTFTAFDDARAIAVSRSLWDSSFTPTAFAYGAGNADYAARSANTIRYETPSFSGFAGAISYGFGENKTAVASATDILSLHIRYVAGPLAVAYGYQNEELAGNTDVDFNQISASYNFGVAAVSGGWNKRDGSTPALGEDTGFTLGVNVPSGAMNFSAGYATEKTKTNGATTAKGSGFALGATYSLSKRTTLYAGYESSKRENGAGVKTAQEKQTTVGVRHDF